MQQCVCHFFFKTMYNKTIIAFRFSAILYNQGLGNLIIQDISKLSSNTVYM